MRADLIISRDSDLKRSPGGRGGDHHHHLHAHHVAEGRGHPILPHLALSDHLCPLQREEKKNSPLLGTRHPQPRFSRPDHQYKSLK